MASTQSPKSMVNYRSVRRIAMAGEVGKTIRKIEGEAESLIEKARAEARSILENANKKVGEILSAEIAMDDVISERDRIISEAQKASEKKIEESKKTAGLIRSASSERIDNFSQLMADHIRGTS